MLIVSLTSYPKRMHIIHHVLYSLFNQTLLPDKIILYLSVQEFPERNSSLPKTLLCFLKLGLEIKWVEENLRSYKKLIYALREFPNEILITADDDTLYPNTWLEKLYYAYKQQPSYIHAHRAHRIRFDELTHLLPYKQWTPCISYTQTTPSFLNFPTTGGGVLYPPKSLHGKVQDVATFMELCPHADDIWFWAMAVLYGSKINVVQDNFNTFNGFEHSGEPLYKLNYTQNYNDIQLANIFAHFPQLKDKLTSSFQTL